MSAGTAYTGGSVERFNRANPCPICDGHDAMRRGQGERCHGFLSSDGEYAHCTRSEHAGGLAPHKGGDTYAHRLTGPCKCGATHGVARAASRRKENAAKRRADKPVPWLHTDTDAAMTHRYEDSSGELLFEMVRFTAEARGRGTPKCKPRHRIGGEWYVGQGPTKGSDVPLYRQAEAVAELEQGGTAYVCEGERDCDAIADAGGVACCNVFGAMKFRDAHARTLAAALRAGEPHARLVVVADADAEGERHAADVFNKLRAAGVRRRAIEVKRAAQGKDAADHLAAKLDLADLIGVEADTLPGIQPRLRVASFAEIEADTVPDAVVERLLFEESPTLYCGLPKRGKSYSAAQMVLALATGTDFLGLAVAHKRVLYLSWELSVAALRDRMRAIARDVGLSDPLPLMRDGSISFFAHRRRSSADRIDLATGDGWAMLRELREDADADVLVLDTVSKVAGLEMKDTTGWAELLTNLNVFCRDERVAVLAIDHANRLRMDENASVVAMGSQTKGAAVPAIVKLTESKHDEPLEKRWKLEVDSWYGDGGAPVWFRRPEVQRNGHTVAGSGCVLSDPPEGGGGVTTKGDQVETWIRNYLQHAGKPVPKAIVMTTATAMKFSTSTVEKVFARIGGRSEKPFQGEAMWSLPEAGDD